MITLEKSIINLSIQREIKTRLNYTVQADALGLGIEALKRLHNIRGIPDGRPINLLPGETKQ